MKQSTRGVTLIELLIVITLLSLLSVAMFTAMRIGLSAFEKADDKLMTSRRVAGAQRILHSEIEGLIPAWALCGAADAVGTGTLIRLPFFGGDPAALRLVSTFSLQEGWRGRPQILELFVIPGEDRGVRLVVNEIPYTGSLSAGRLCRIQPDAGLQFVPVQAGPQSFVLADKLAYCRFAYLAPATGPEQPEHWVPVWNKPVLPLAVRVEMAPLQADASRLQPLSITAPIHLHRDPEALYEDKPIGDR